MRRIIRFFKDKFYIELGLASFLFVIALMLDMLMEFIIYMLYFIIFLEIVRAVVNYIREQRVILSLLVDAFIILALRELIVNVVKINTEKIDSVEALFASSLNYNILIISGVIIFLLIVRYLSVKTSQKYLMDKMKNCDCHD
ncbi:phosphate-starvation-inducible PsiE family protein [Arcobacter sp. LA11]|uniref:phosphate-starvation-inducible PsiE family protein n=1 Tax=Arcobacter sp. LA11 TaxID=1898176 RepID=UPI00093232EE|nr:phosphate-starvation-inducible PsiE family protein [Arcobacter sp. LA11]